MVIREISPTLRDFIASQGLKVLRRRKDNMPLNVSYSVDGLTWTANKLGRAIYFKRAFISSGRIKFPHNVKAEMSPDVYVEDFIPRNHLTESAQVAEYTWVNKALKLCY